MFNSTDRPGRVFRDELYLTNDHEPEEPVGREQEIQEIADFVQQVRHQSKPENLLVHGPAGTGKTTCVKHVLNQAEEETPLKTIWVNCWQYNTRPALLTELLIQIGYPAPRKGKPIDELLSKIREWLDKQRGVIIGLDEFDQLQHQSEVVYDLHMTNQQSQNPLGQIMVSNNGPDHLQLEERSQSRLNYQELEFQNYTKEQLVEILRDRVEQAFLPGAVSDQVLEDIGDKVVDRGDCRKALSMLLKAGREAEENGVGELTPKLLKKSLTEC